MPYLQEVHLADSGSFREKEYGFFPQGTSSEDCREYKVKLAVRNALPKIVEPGVKGSECLLFLLTIPVMVR